MWWKEKSYFLAPRARRRRKNVRNFWYNAYMKTASRDKYQDVIKSAVLKYLSPVEYEIFLFGSQATGKQKRWSDFDIGVIGKNNQSIPSRVRYDIELELDRLNVPFIVDLVDFSTVEDAFKRVALQSRQVWTN